MFMYLFFRERERKREHTQGGEWQREGDRI